MSCYWGANWSLIAQNLIVILCIVIALLKWTVTKYIRIISALKRHQQQLPIQINPLSSSSVVCVLIQLRLVAFNIRPCVVWFCVLLFLGMTSFSEASPLPACFWLAGWMNGHSYRGESRRWTGLWLAVGFLFLADQREARQAQGSRVLGCGSAVDGGRNQNFLSVRISFDSQREQIIKMDTSHSLCPSTVHSSRVMFIGQVEFIL